MVILKTTLKNFIQSIPVCDCYSSWEEIVSMIRQSSPGMVAYIDDCGRPQGVIQSNDLLWLTSKKLIAAPFTEERVKVKPDRLKDIITSLVSLSYQMRVETFLQSFALKNRQTQNYFIVDLAGKLLGILDTSKLLQTIWHYNSCRGEEKSNLSEITTFSDLDVVLPRIITSSNNHSNARAIKPKKELVKVFPKKANKKNKIEQKFQEDYSWLFSLLNQISLPLLIENKNQEVCYQNNSWQQNCTANRSLEPSHTIDRDLDIRASTIHFGKRVLDGNSDRYSSAKDLLSIDSLFGFELNSSSSKQSIQEESVNSILEQITSESSNVWYYYRIPLKLSHNSIKIENDYNYWLTFATPFSLQQFLLQDSFRKDNLEPIKKHNLKQLQDKFLINIGHDFKSPLTAIIGLSSLLKEEKLGTLNERQIDYAEIIHNSGKRLVNLTNDFLDFTHLTSQTLQFDFETLELKNTCQQVYQQVEEKLIKEYQDVKHFPKLQLNIATHTQKAIADKTYLHQILSILLENALHLTSCQGLLGITTALWSNNWLAITVWNEKDGLTSQQQQIFAEEFYQYSSVLTSQEKNQSLKLILAQQLAQAHGGDISFISQDDYGSEFTLVLPLKSNNSNEDKIQNKFSNPLVLIVETGSERIIDLSKKLKTLGYFSAIARSHSEALYKAKCLKPQKILLNSSFLDNEPDIIKTLKFDLQTRDIPLLITTDCSSSSDSFTNVADVLSFPISRNSLARYFPLVVSHQKIVEHNLTVLRLSLIEDTTQSLENSALDFVFEKLVFSLSYHIIEADSIEQAHLLAKIWTIDVIVWDGTTLTSTEFYLRSFAESKALASIPVITLDEKTTAIANKITTLTVFPCLLPAKERSIEQLTKVIQIAAGIG